MFCHLTLSLVFNKSGLFSPHTVFKHKPVSKLHSILLNCFKWSWKKTDPITFAHKKTNNYFSCIFIKIIDNGAVSQCDNGTLFLNFILELKKKQK